MPNAISPVIVAGTLALATSIIDAAGLGFLGLGPQDPATPEWGTMLTDTVKYLDSQPCSRSCRGSRSSSSSWGSTSSATDCAKRSTRSCAGVSEPLLSVDGLRVEFTTERGTIYAVNDISFSIREGETLGIVGESGCGKSVTSLALLGHPRSCRPRRGGHRDVRRAGSLDDVGPGAPRCARQGDRDDLPGSDDEPEPGAHDRRPDSRGTHDALRLVDARSQRPSRRASRPGGDTRTRDREPRTTRISSRAGCGSAR